MPSPEKSHQGLVAAGPIETALIESEGVTMISVDSPSCNPEGPSGKLCPALTGALLTGNISCCLAGHPAPGEIVLRACSQHFEPADPCISVWRVEVVTCFIVV